LSFAANSRQLPLARVMPFFPLSLEQKGRRL